MSDNTTLLNLIQLAAGAAAFIALYWIETVRPFFLDRRNRAKHAGRNLALGLFNAALIAIAFAWMTINLCSWVERNGIGILNLSAIDGWLTALIAIVLLDGWMYVWHRLNHTSRFLWRFHRMHHSDSEMDASTALRFHPGEIIISAAARMAIVPVLGLEFRHLLIYDAILLPVILLHHSNAGLPERGDRLLRALIVSPNIHRVHHSQVKAETNSNYASVFSFWDRLAGTLRLNDNIRSIRFGVKELSGSRWQTIARMMATPFAPLSPDAEKKKNRSPILREHPL